METGTERLLGRYILGILAGCRNVSKLFVPKDIHSIPFEAVSLPGRYSL
jgi:hypothetical protein